MSESVSTADLVARLREHANGPLSAFGNPELEHIAATRLAQLERELALSRETYNDYRTRMANDVVTVDMAHDFPEHVVEVTALRAQVERQRDALRQAREALAYEMPAGSPGRAASRRALAALGAALGETDARPALKETPK